MRIILSILTMLFVVGGNVYGQQSIMANGELTASADDKTALKILTPQNLKCDILVETHTDKTVKVEFNKWANAKSLKQEQRFVDLIDIKLGDNTSADENLRLRVLTPISAPWEGSDYSAGVNFEIWVPENFEIESRNSYSTIVLLGPFNGVRVDNEYGPIRVEDVRGRLVVKTSYSEVELSGIEGEISVETSYGGIRASRLTISENPGYFETSYGDIMLDNIEGPVKVLTSYDSIIASDIDAGSGSVVLRTSYGKIKAENIKGEIVCETSYNPIDLENVNFTHGINMIETKYSPINLDNMNIDEARLFVNNTYGSINISLVPDVSARLILSVDEGGSIHTSGFSIKPLAMERNRLEGIIGNGESKIELNVNGIGEINIRGK